MYPKVINGDTAYTVEYSNEQGAFHIDLLRNVLAGNTRMLGDTVVNDYKIVAITESPEEAIVYARAMREVLDQKKTAKEAGHPQQ